MAPRRDFRSLASLLVRCVVEHEAVGVRVAQAQPSGGAWCVSLTSALFISRRIGCRIIHPAR
jgi:hypothetical protein